MRLLLRRNTKDRVEGGLGLVLAIEEQRVILPARDRPIVEPGIAVRDIPEGHARDGAAMLQEDAEEIGVARGELLLDGVGKAVCVGIEAFARLHFQIDICGGLQTALGQHVDVEFGDDDLEAQRFKG